jgi:hypothetical protein
MTPTAKSARPVAMPGLRSREARGLGEAAHLPFVYAVQLPLRGEPGRVVEGVIATGADSGFMATSISYGFEQQRGQDISVTPLAVNNAQSVPSLVLGQFPVAALLRGVRLNPRYLATLLNTDPALVGMPGILAAERGLSDQPFGQDFLARAAFETVAPPAQVQFRMSLIDTGSGRELQDQPVHSLASLGDAGGKRPFRHFAQPFFLERRSTLRVQVIEESAGTAGTLFVALHGFRALPQTDCGLDQWPMGPVLPPRRALPFDHVARLTLEGIPGRVSSRELQVEASNGFRITSVGYGLSAGEDTAPLQLQGQGNNFDLGNVRVDQLPADAWVDGIRLRPSFLRYAVTPNGALNDTAPSFAAPMLFERLNRPEDVSFRFRIEDQGLGRELQNTALHNIAGLGAADGRRPFLRLARPWELSARSTVRVSVEEVFGRGELYFVFHGYHLPAMRRSAL